MRQLVVIKTGSTMPSLALRQGDFEHWILAGMGLAATDGRVNVVDVTAGQPLPTYDKVAGVVISGSHDMVTDRLPWSEQTAAWLPGLVDRRIPTLGICFGHQLLAYALGGRVAVNPRGRSVGSIDVALEPAAADDPLLVGLPSPVIAYVSHTQSVVELPPGARQLAASPRDPHHAFVVANCAWGVQFHPEFDAAITMAYVDTFRKVLEAEGQDADSLRDGCPPASPTAAVLTRFYQLTRTAETNLP